MLSKVPLTAIAMCKCSAFKGDPHTTS